MYCENGIVASIYKVNLNIVFNIANSMPYCLECVWSGNRFRGNMKSDFGIGVID